GQRQRVSCARALAHGPQLLLADEPTAALDPLNAARVMQLLLSRARDQGTCCVITTHDEVLARNSGLQIRRIACQRDADGGVTATLGEAC
ncbi:ATP-binding cassette domain-containing protein, partial [Pseudomonas sp. CF161]